MCKLPNTSEEDNKSKHSVKQESIPVGCIPPTCKPHVLVGTTRCQCRRWVRHGTWNTHPPGRTQPLLVTPGHHHWTHTHHSPREQTDTCENITFPRLRLLSAINNPRPKLIHRTADTQFSH